MNNGLFDENEFDAQMKPKIHKRKTLYNRSNLSPKPRQVQIGNLRVGHSYFFERGREFIVGTVVSVNENTVDLKNAYTVTGRLDESGRIQSSRLNMPRMVKAQSHFQLHYIQGSRIFAADFTSPKRLPDTVTQLIREFTSGPE
jgi:hypothetical protein